jgi:hypothetical protein
VVSQNHPEFWRGRKKQLLITNCFTANLIKGEIHGSRNLFFSWKDEIVIFDLGNQSGALPRNFLSDISIPSSPVSLGACLGSGRHRG